MRPAPAVHCGRGLFLLVSLILGAQQDSTKRIQRENEMDGRHLILVTIHVWYIEGI